MAFCCHFDYVLNYSPIFQVKIFISDNKTIKALCNFIKNTQIYENQSQESRVFFFNFRVFGDLHFGTFALLCQRYSLPPFWHLTDFLMTVIGHSLCFPDSTCPSSCTEKVWENMIWLCPLFAWVWFTNWLTKMELFWPLYWPSLTTTLENIILNCLLLQIIFEFFHFFLRFLLIRTDLVEFLLELFVNFNKFTQFSFRIPIKSQMCNFELIQRFFMQINGIITTILVIIFLKNLFKLTFFNLC